MKDKRTYYSKISKSFTTIAVVIFIAMTIIETSLSMNIASSRNHAMESQLETGQRTTAMLFSAISDSVLALSIDSSLEDWLLSPIGSPSYYFNAIRVRNILKEKSPVFENTQYQIAITRPEDDAFVITATETMRKKDFLSEYGYDDSKVALVSEELRILSDEDGKIISIHEMVERRVGSGELIIYLYIPLLGDIGEMDDIELSVMDAATGRIYGPDQRLENVGLTLKDIAGGATIVKKGGYLLIPVKLPFSDSIVLFSNYDDTLLPMMLVVILGLVGAGALVGLFSSRMTHALYRPVEEAVKNIPKSSGDGPVNDEFAFIVDNCRKISVLHEELEKAEKAHYMLSEQQKYRAFLRGVGTQHLESDETSYFSFALASLSEENPKADFIFSRLDSLSREIEHLHSVRVTKTRNAYIYKHERKEDSYRVLYSTVQAFTYHLEGIEDIRFAISGTTKGYQGIKDLFVKAEEIMQFRYRVRNRFILTEDDLSGNLELMNYTFSDERMLINEIIAENDDAIGLFDEIVARNFSDERRLSPSEAARFTYAMIGTAVRVFQELKESPETLLGHEVDFSSLFKEKDHYIAIDRIRSILAETIDAKKEKSGEEDDLMIGRMKEYIKDHYHENIMLIDLSEKFNLTPKYCSTLFKKFSNDTFKNYLNQMRIEKACRILEKNPGMKIQDLSEKVGFSSSNSFIRAFSRVMGITPGTYAENVSSGRYAK